MSHFTRIQTKITDLTALTQALQELGFTNIKQSPSNSLTINGIGSSYTGCIVATGDFTAPEYGTRQMRNVQRQFGFEREADGTHTLHIDPWALGGDGFIGKLRDQIQQKYAAVVAKNNLMAQGFVMTEEVTEDGEIHMTLVRV